MGQEVREVGPRLRQVGNALHRGCSFALLTDYLVARCVDTLEAASIRLVDDSGSSENVPQNSETTQATRSGFTWNHIRFTNWRHFNDNALAVGRGRKSKLDLALRFLEAEGVDIEGLEPEAPEETAIIENIPLVKAWLELSAG